MAVDGSRITGKAEVMDAPIVVFYFKIGASAKWRGLATWRFHGPKAGNSGGASPRRLDWPPKATSSRPRRLCTGAPATVARNNVAPRHPGNRDRFFHSPCAWFVHVYARSHRSRLGQAKEQSRDIAADENSAPVGHLTTRFASNTAAIFNVPLSHLPAKPAGLMRPNGTLLLSSALPRLRAPTLRLAQRRQRDKAS